MIWHPRLNIIEGQGRDFVALSGRLLRNCRLAQQRVPVLRCYAEVFDPVFDLILTFHSNLTTIRHNSLREAGSHEIFPLCLDLLSHPQQMRVQLAAFHDGR